MTEKSEAQRLHNHLAERPNGFKFTSVQLEDVFPEMTSGAVTGFLHRAHKKGMIEPKAMRGNKFLYELIDNTVIWKFKKPSHGGVTGRRCDRKVESTQLPVIESKPKTKVKKEPVAKPIGSYTLDEIISYIKREFLK